MPLEFAAGESAETLELRGEEIYHFSGIGKTLEPGTHATVVARGTNEEKKFKAVVRIDTPEELSYYRSGGILKYVLQRLIQN